MTPINHPLWVPVQGTGFIPTSPTQPQQVSACCLVFGAAGQPNCRTAMELEGCTPVAKGFDGLKGRPN